MLRADPERYAGRVIDGLQGVLHVLLVLAGGTLLWVGGTVVFDGVHWLLHRMLRSRLAPVRALAWPHAIHHRWLDRELRIHPDLQGANVVCHLIPEFLTQLAYSGLLLLVLPVGPVAVCIALQTLAFGYVISQRGLDINHRPVEILDAYVPSFVCPPPYHALHHVFPDAYYSAYTKLVDQVVGGAAWLAGRRYALLGADTPFGKALGDALAAAGAAEMRPIERPGDAARSDLDVLLLCDAAAEPTPFVEAFVAATVDRLLPPEVWLLRACPDDPTARHYVRDVRVACRVLYVPGVASLDAGAARHAVGRALSRVRRGLHFVPVCGLAEAGRGWRRFRRTRPRRPAAAPAARSRLGVARSLPDRPPPPARAVPPSEPSRA